MFSVKASTAVIALSGADVELNFACPVHQTNHRSAGAVVAHAATIAPENPGDLLSLVNSVARLFALLVVPHTNAMSQMTSKCLPGHCFEVHCLYIHGQTETQHRLLSLWRLVSFQLLDLTGSFFVWLHSLPSRERDMLENTECGR